MREETARALRALNDRFYEQTCESFGQTRHNRWPGWEILLETVDCPHAVGDFACGNLRFEAFLERAYPGVDFAFTAVDHTAFPAWDQVRAAVDFRQADLLDSPDLELEPLDLAVSFGFMHHIPGQAARLDYLRWLASQVRLGGWLAVSFWRFLDEPSLAAKTMPVPAEFADADALDPGDAFLGWQNTPDLVRYCHSFSDADIDELVAGMSPAAQVEARYRADGRSGVLNEYVVWRVRHAETVSSLETFSSH